MAERVRQVAVQEARRVVLANPDQPLFWVELAHRLRLNDQVSEALSWARWAVRAELWPEQEVDPRAWTLLGHLCLDVGWFDQAELAYRRGCRQHSQARALLGQGDWFSAWAMAEQRWTENAIATETRRCPISRAGPKSMRWSWDEQVSATAFKRCVGFRGVPAWSAPDPGGALPRSGYCSRVWLGWRGISFASVTTAIGRGCATARC